MSLEEWLGTASMQQKGGGEGVLLLWLCGALAEEVALSRSAASPGFGGEHRAGSSPLCCWLMLFPVMFWWYGTLRNEHHDSFWPPFPTDWGSWDLAFFRKKTLNKKKKTNPFQLPTSLHCGIQHAGIHFGLCFFAKIGWRISECHCPCSSFLTLLSSYKLQQHDFNSVKTDVTSSLVLLDTLSLSLDLAWLLGHTNMWIFLTHCKVWRWFWDSSSLNVERGDGFTASCSALPL